MNNDRVRLSVQEEEQAALDDEAERRRKRVQAWQEQKAKAAAQEEADAQEAALKAKGWSLEDDLDEVWSIMPNIFHANGMHAHPSAHKVHIGCSQPRLHVEEVSSESRCVLKSAFCPPDFV